MEFRECFIARKYQEIDFEKVREIFNDGTSAIFRSAISDLFNGQNQKTQILHFSVFIFCLLISALSSPQIGLTIFFSFEFVIFYSIYDIFCNRARFLY